jgi:hypothetical protein
MNNNLVAKLFRGILRAKFFEEPGHWRTWRRSAVEAEQEKCVLVVFQIPETGYEETIRGIKLHLVEKLSAKSIT